MQIAISSGKFTQIDEQDYELVMRRRWSFSKGYVVAQVAGRLCPLHRHLLDAPPHLLVDHINGDKLDNRRSNLRLCVKSENNINSRLHSRNTSGYRGVYWHKKSGKWMARLGVYGKCHYLGLFSSASEASMVYEAEALRVYGQFVRPKSGPSWAEAK